MFSMLKQKISLENIEEFVDDTFDYTECSDDETSDKPDFIQTILSVIEVDVDEKNGNQMAPTQSIDKRSDENYGGPFLRNKVNTKSAKSNLDKQTVNVFANVLSNNATKLDSRTPPPSSPLPSPRKFNQASARIKEVNEFLNSRSIRLYGERKLDYGRFKLVHYDEPKEDGGTVDGESLNQFFEINEASMEKKSSILLNSEFLEQQKCSDLPRLTVKKSQVTFSEDHLNTDRRSLVDSISGGVSHDQNLKSPVLKGNWVPSKPISPKVVNNRKDTKKRSSKKFTISKSECPLVFNPSVIRGIMNSILSINFSGLNYRLNELQEKCKNTSNQLKEAVKPQYSERYRIVVLVSVIENKQQAVTFVSRGLYDQERDKITEVLYCNGTFYISALIYAIYKE